MADLHALLLSCDPQGNVTKSKKISPCFAVCRASGHVAQSHRLRLVMQRPPPMPPSHRRHSLQSRLKESRTTSSDPTRDSLGSSTAALALAVSLGETPPWRTRAVDRYPISVSASIFGPLKKHISRALRCTLTICNRAQHLPNSPRIKFFPWVQWKYGFGGPPLPTKAEIWTAPTQKVIFNGTQVVQKYEVLLQFDHLPYGTVCFPSQ